MQETASRRPAGYELILSCVVVLTGIAVARAILKCFGFRLPPR